MHNADCLGVSRPQWHLYDPESFNPLEGILPVVWLFQVIPPKTERFLTFGRVLGFRPGYFPFVPAGEYIAE